MKIETVSHRTLEAVADARLQATKRPTASVAPVEHSSEDRDCPT